MPVTESHLTPEGYDLARPLLLPNVRSFDELFEFKAVWNHKTMSHFNGKLPANTPRPEPRYIGGNELGPFCAVRLQHGRGVGRSLAVVARDVVLDAIAPRIVTPDDRLSFEIIEHHGRDRALVICQHGYIIGNHWLAYIDPDTIPGQEQ